MAEAGWLCSSFKKAFCCGAKPKSVRRLQTDDTALVSEVSTASLLSKPNKDEEQPRESSKRSKRERRGKSSSRLEKKKRGSAAEVDEATRRQHSETESSEEAPAPVRKTKKKSKETEKKSKEADTKGKEEKRKSSRHKSEAAPVPETPAAKEKSSKRKSKSSHSASRPLVAETDIKQESVESLRSASVSKHANTSLSQLSTENKRLTRSVLRARDDTYSSMEEEKPAAAENSTSSFYDDLDSRLGRISQYFQDDEEATHAIVDDSGTRKKGSADIEEASSYASPFNDGYSTMDNSSDADTEISYMIDFYDKRHFNRMLAKKMENFLNKRER
ncbi:hypothetical protein PAPHI01_1630 [Pancytospora philotis]|nr:hypothetical protein PAPHI01_1630 [Pancytospora philotis]